MTDKARIRYLPIVQDDLIAIYDFIAKDSPDRGLTFIEKLDERIGVLGLHPQLGRLPRNMKLREYGYRVLIVESYLVFYVVRGRLIGIHRVVHGTKNLDHIIKSC